MELAKFLNLIEAVFQTGMNFHVHKRLFLQELMYDPSSQVFSYAGDSVTSIDIIGTIVYMSTCDKCQILKS